MNKNEKWHRHLGAYGICIDEEKLLVIRKGKGPYIGRYDLPGGTVEAKESLTAAVKREFLEEAGINVDVKKNVGVCDYLIPYELPKRETSHIHHIAVFYLVHIMDGTLSQNPEQFKGQDSLGALWVSIHDIAPGNSSPLVIQVKDWLKTEQILLEVQRLDGWIVLEK